MGIGDERCRKGYALGSSAPPPLAGMGFGEFVAWPLRPMSRMVGLESRLPDVASADRVLKEVRRALSSSC